MDLIKCYSQCTKKQVADHGDRFWDTWTITPTSTLKDRNDINDTRILSNMFDEYLLFFLIIYAKKQVNDYLSARRKSLNNENYIDGAVWYWYITHLTQPNNDRLAESIFEKIKYINIKEFKFSSKSMIVRFKELTQKLDALDVSYDENTRQFDL